MVPAGSVSVTTIGAAAVAGPLLLTVTVHDALSPTTTVGVLVVLVIARSACCWNPKSSVTSTSPAVNVVLIGAVVVATKPAGTPLVTATVYAPGGRFEIV